MVRGKTVLKSIENETSRQVTFSKRRTGMFKKAKELAILCDVQIGVIVFTNTGHLFDFSNCNMRSIIERYHQVKESQQYVVASTEAKFWQGKAERLRQQLHDLQQNQRQLLGEHISGLKLNDLQTLESQVEASLTNVRLQKEQIMLDQIEQFNEKMSLINNENVELQHNTSIIIQENDNLKKEVHGLREINRKNNDSVTQYSINTQDRLNVACLELCQPYNEETEPADTPTLELRLH